MSPRISLNVDLALGEAAAPDRKHHDGIVEQLFSRRLIVHERAIHNLPAQALVEGDHGLVTHKEAEIYSHFVSHKALSVAYEVPSEPPAAPTLLGDDAPNPSDGDLDTAYVYDPAQELDVGDELIVEPTEDVVIDGGPDGVVIVFDEGGYQPLPYLVLQFSWQLGGWKDVDSESIYGIYRHGTSQTYSCSQQDKRSEQVEA
jgi:hypothetical protein